jgi:Zn-dependent protease with chaperone function
MLSIYKFIQLQISKSVEYRADRQAAMAIGGQNMAQALRPLGNSGYFSIFSSHPLTSHRIKNVLKVKKSEDTIGRVYGTNATFLLSFLMIILIVYFSYRAAKIHILVKAYQGVVLSIKNKYILLKSIFTILTNKYFMK